MARGLSLDCFTSYLSDRRQFVSLGCIDSDVHTISYGVPQGSVLGPLLFLLFINDFQNSSKKLDFHLFADDANLFYINKSLIDLECQVNQELVNVQNWLLSTVIFITILSVQSFIDIRIAILKHISRLPKQIT